ncbi:MAG: DUF2461 domain-containing protein [Acidobacteriota bacterium]|nr:DUF2461 domain-containing protein [Acidobacteriota bacterium]
MPTHFTPEALKFLRGLERHNDRTWFDPRKPIFERELKVPMLALIEDINHALATFAPEHMRPPHKALFRIYRDTRFDKSRGTPEKPYKTHIAAWWARAGLEKKSGAGFYIHLSAKEVAIAAGMYMPAPEQLLAVRRYLLDHHEELRDLLANRKLRAAMHEFEGHKLTRPPRGFPADTPALDLIACRQWGLSATLPAEAATQPSLLKEITSRFALAAPVIEFLNRPIVASDR